MKGHARYFPIRIGRRIPFSRPLLGILLPTGILLLMTAYHGAAATQDLTDLDLQELMEIKVASVYGASKYLQPLLDAPAAVSIVSAADIRQQGYRTLADVLQGVRDFYVS